jgi:hypothetical protein
MVGVRGMVHSHIRNELNFKLDLIGGPATGSKNCEVCMRTFILALIQCFACATAFGQGVTEDKFWGQEDFPRSTVGLCRVTAFPAHEFHFRCRSYEDFHEAHKMLMQSRALEFNGYGRDFRDLPEYISFWVKLRDPKAPHMWKCIQ